MKKALLTLFIAMGATMFAGTGKYKLNEQALDKAFAKAEQTSFENMYSNSINAIASQSMAKGDGGKTRGGYLLRSFFCGGIALHRYYMGTSRGGMWAMYFCIPIVGGVDACVDFWWVVFEADAYKKYENNDKYIVWMD